MGLMDTLKSLGSKDDKMPSDWGAIEGSEYDLNFSGKSQKLADSDAMNMLYRSFPYDPNTTATEGEGLDFGGYMQELDPEVMGGRVSELREMGFGGSGSKDGYDERLKQVDPKFYNEEGGMSASNYVEHMMMMGEFTDKVHGGDYGSMVQSARRAETTPSSEGPVPASEFGPVAELREPWETFDTEGRYRD